MSQHPIVCTSCHQSFQSWRNWQEHRAVIRPWQMAAHDDHTRRCLSQREWAMAVLAEVQAIQDEMRQSV